MVQKKEAKKNSEEQADADVPQGAEVAEGLDSDVDDILDEIDDVLEENAEAFVNAYIQKGGQ